MVFKFLIHGVAEQLSHLTDVSRYEKWLRKAFHYEIKFDFTHSTDMYFLEKTLTEEEIIEKYIEENVDTTKRDIILFLVKQLLEQGSLISESVGTPISEEELIVQIKNYVINPATPNVSSKKTASNKDIVRVSSHASKKNSNSKPLSKTKPSGKSITSLEDFLGEE